MTGSFEMEGFALGATILAGVIAMGLSAYATFTARPEPRKVKIEKDDRPRRRD